MFIVDLRSYFTPVAIGQVLKKLPPLKTPVMDIIFSDRQQRPLPVIGVDEITATTQTVPVVRRGAASTPISGDNKTIGYIEPLPVRPSDFLGAKDLNDFKLLDSTASRQTWVSAKTDSLRRIVRWTTEALCSQALTGVISYPLKLEGGYDTYRVDYAAPHTVEITKKWDAADLKIKDVYANLLDMHQAIEEAGFGGEVEIWAGKKVYPYIVNLADSATPKDKIKVEVGKDGGVWIGEFLIKRRAETYKEPENGTATPIVAENKIVMIGKDGGHRLFYAAVDDMDANLLPMPFFVKPIETKDPSGVKLLAESKPLPAPNTHAICWADALAAV